MLTAAHACSTISGVQLVAGLPEHGSLSTDSRPSVKCLCHTFICTALVASSLKAFWIIRIISEERCSSLTQNLMQIHCYACPNVLNAITTQYTCSLSSVYSPQWLVKWNHHFSHICIPVHSSCLSSYIDVTQTVLIILTMAGLFLDRPHKLKPEQLTIICTSISLLSKCSESQKLTWDSDMVFCYSHRSKEWKPGSPDVIGLHDTVGQDGMRYHCRFFWPLPISNTLLHSWRSPTPSLPVP